MKNSCFALLLLVAVVACGGKSQPKFIEIEFNWHQLFRKTTLNYFSEQLPNYDVYQLTFDNWIQRDPKDPLTNIYYFSNFIFVKKYSQKHIADS